MFNFPLEKGETCLVGKNKGGDNKREESEQMTCNQGFFRLVKVGGRGERNMGNYKGKGKVKYGGKKNKHFTPSIQRGKRRNGRENPTSLKEELKKTRGGRGGRESFISRLIVVTEKGGGEKKKKKWRGNFVYDTTTGKADNAGGLKRVTCEGKEKRIWACRGT